MKHSRKSKYKIDIKGDNNSLDLSVTKNEKNNEITFSNEFKHEENLADFNKRMDKAATIITIITFIASITSYLHGLIKDNFSSNHKIFIAICAFFMFLTIGLYLYHRVFFNFRKSIKFGPDYTRVIRGDKILSYELSAKCLKCDGKVELKKATYQRNDKTHTTVIGVCNKSTHQTKHYYDFDDITNTGVLLDQTQARIYSVI
ncbi:hypothetical protein [Fusibacter sp. JL216-2]|uniref:hypothetical protein n=1 Tax=Fusibacter sp. JL216-2 TaxID=3071453 RepID=UPI003D327768